MFVNYLGVLEIDPASTLKFKNFKIFWWNIFYNGEITGG